jgi:hypothetical protein
MLESAPDVPKPGAGPTTERANPNPNARPAPRPAAPGAGSRRSPGILGRFLPAPYPPRGADDRSRSSIAVEPSSDPAAEAALKRRVEHQIRQALGDRVRDVEVRVVGRNVTIRARATRFWQRRGVRRSLETLPGLAGYRPTIEILE